MTSGEYGFEAIPFGENALRGQGPELLTPAERAAIEAYALGGFERINRALRGQVPMTPELAQRIDRIRTGSSKYPLPTTVRVTRESEAALFGIVDDVSARALIDNEFLEEGFLSTSGKAQPPHSTSHADPVVLDLVVPAGTPALRLGELAEISEERELLVIDARRYFVVGVSYEGTMWRIYAIVMEVEQ